MPFKLIRHSRKQQITYIVANSLQSKRIETEKYVSTLRDFNGGLAAK
jgi:hypothetical protein